MRRVALIGVAIAVFLMLSAIIAEAQAPVYQPSPYIYRIAVKQCALNAPDRTLTGFRVEGMVGVVTALHGVAGCKSITAQPELTNMAPLRNLEIVRVDIDRDVALLWSPTLETMRTDGLELAQAAETADYLSVDVVGFPFGVYRQRMTPNGIVVDRTQLANILPPAVIRPLSERDSPAIDVEVLSLQTHLVPGHSGAPILDKSGKLLAVADGGLGGGTVEMSWALPWQDIEWKTVSFALGQPISWTDMRRLVKLSSIDSMLFADASSTPAEPTGSAGTAPTNTSPTSTAAATKLPAKTPTPKKTPVLHVAIDNAGEVREIGLAPPGGE